MAPRKKAPELELVAEPGEDEEVGEEFSSVSYGWARNQRLDNLLRRWLGQNGPRSRLSLHRMDVEELLWAVEGQRDGFELMVAIAQEVVSEYDAEGYHERDVV